MVYISLTTVPVRISYWEELKKNLDSLLVEIDGYSKVIVGYHKPEGIWKKNEMTFNEINWIVR
jgi:hypothetical protein